ncbi:MAG: Fe-S cluster assembly scaffold SufA [Roseibium sp.]|uniref:Fe-S cluster assembly scaffold SufA n=1 Tax=Roseibium sp. TaxID=1936156 RepID=UPI001B169158|nr:Fe-S cluster assembly scaffold SufA [Roseibium sp.]MBO6507268.1 Fe-S cluster assembly scaffold SufA [Roseibium sp.]MBO6894985.1 Fe-S cluster assembly scaffold SufA [Roseibium sp.]MBO6929069.1 Fe-S cluster assembly scaffold SufA [Roseibium sp.]
MVSAGKFQVMTLTDAAAGRVKELVENSDKNAVGLRVGIKKGGCAGMEYTMDMVEEAQAGDDIIEDKGAKLFVDPSAVLFLLGTEMDFEVTKFRSGFVFKNPNEVSACGCGESVSLQAADLSNAAQ